MGIIAISVDATSLMAHSQQVRHIKKEKNIDAMVNMFMWLSSRSDIGVDPRRIAFAGYGAGVAIITEAAFKLFKRYQADIESGVTVEPAPYPKALLYLDGVPWKSTIDKGADASLNMIVRDPSTRNVESPHPIVVCSLRGEKSMWNADGMILQLLTRGLGKATAAGAGSAVTDIKINGARHLDFACTKNKGSDKTGLEVHPVKRFFFKTFNLMSKDDVQITIQNLVVSFFISELIEGGGGSGALQTKADGDTIQDQDCFDRVVKEMTSNGKITIAEVGRSAVTELVSYRSYLL